MRFTKHNRFRCYRQSTQISKQEMQLEGIHFTTLVFTTLEINTRTRRASRIVGVTETQHTINTDINQNRNWLPSKHTMYMGKGKVTRSRTQSLRYTSKRGQHRQKNKC